MRLFSDITIDFWCLKGKGRGSKWKDESFIFFYIYLFVWEPGVGHEYPQCAWGCPGHRTQVLRLSGERLYPQNLYQDMTFVSPFRLSWL